MIMFPDGYMIGGMMNSNIILSDGGDEWKLAYYNWLNNINSHRTRETYATAFDQFFAASGLHPAEVQKQHIITWKELMRQQGLADTTINLKLAALSSFYASQKLRDDNPSDGVKRMPVSPYGKATWLEDDQDLLLLASIDRNTVQGKRDYAILMLFLTTAVRLSAITSATRKSLSRRGASVTFTYANKGGKTVTKKLMPKTITAIQDYLNARTDKDEALWLANTGFPIYDRFIQRMVKSRGDEVFGEGHSITPHSLRHTAAKHAMRVGTVDEVQLLLTHSDPRVTLIYTSSISPERADKLSANLDDRYST